jgi:hypothetical protein
MNLVEMTFSERGITLDDTSLFMTIVCSKVIPLQHFVIIAGYTHCSSLIIYSVIPTCPKNCSYVT